MAAASTVINLGHVHMRRFSCGSEPEDFIQGQSPGADKGYMLHTSYHFYVVQTPVSYLGSHSRCVLSLQDIKDRRFLHWLVCSLRWPSSQKDLEVSWLANQLLWNDGCISDSEIIPPAVKGLPCPSAGGQYCSSLLHVNRLTQQVLFWAQDKLLSLFYIPGHINVGADRLWHTGYRNSTPK